MISHCAASGTRTRTAITGQGILSPSCLPIPPLRLRGAENGTRTRDPNLGKVVLYQLSYFRVLLVEADLNAMQRYCYFLEMPNLFRLFFAQTAFLVWFWPFFGVAGWLKMRFACQSLLTVSMAPSLRSQTRYSMSRLPPSVQAPMLCSRY